MLVAIPLLLKANLRRIARESGITLYAFLLRTACTTVAAFMIVPMERGVGAQMAGALGLGLLGMLLFFVTVGAEADIGALAENGALIFLFAFLVVAIRLELMLPGQSAACGSGPSRSPHLAALREHHRGVGAPRRTATPARVCHTSTPATAASVEPWAVAVGPVRGIS